MSTTAPSNLQPAAAQPAETQRTQDSPDASATTDEVAAGSPTSEVAEPSSSPEAGPSGAKVSRFPSIKKFVRGITRRMSFLREEEEGDSVAFEELDDPSRRSSFGGLFGRLPRSHSGLAMRYTEPLKAGDDYEPPPQAGVGGVEEEQGQGLGGGDGQDKGDSTNDTVAVAGGATTAEVGVATERSPRQAATASSDTTENIDMLFVEEQARELASKSSSVGTDGALADEDGGVAVELFGEGDEKAEIARRRSLRKRNGLSDSIAESMESVDGDNTMSPTPGEMSSSSSSLSLVGQSMQSLPSFIDGLEEISPPSPKSKMELKPILKNRHNRDWLEMGVILRGGQVDPTMTAVVDRLLQERPRTTDPQPATPRRERKNIVFYETVEIILTFRKSEYSRKPDPNSTFLHLNNKVKAAIRKELNDYKRFEMTMHEHSKDFTVFH